MAKRANPYAEDYIQQRKVHISLKQLNNNEDGMKKVYEKTLDLLFRGANKISKLEADTATFHNDFANKKDNMKQLCISKDGRLLHSATPVLRQQELKTCCACNSSSVEAPCAYCERALCAVCQHACSLCHRSYCNHCSLFGAEGSEVCVSCYG